MRSNLGLVACFCCLLCRSWSWAAPAPAVDGFLNDPFWTTDARVFEAADAALPDNRAVFYLGFDSRHLFFAADVADPNVFGHRRQRKDRVWEDDAVELFIDFGEGGATERTPETYEYGFSVAGGVNWTRGRGDGTGTEHPAVDWPPAWDSGVQWAIGLKPGTTLNMGADKDRGYTVEARIPLSELGQEPPLRPDRLIGVSFLCLNRPVLKGQEDRPLATVRGVDFSNNHNPSLWQRIPANWMGPLPIRGLVRSLPLWLGTSLYSNQWKRYASAETDPTGPWLNRETWTDKLAEMAADKLNALLLLHPHPFPGLLPLAQFAEASYFAPQELTRQMEQFQWLLAEAERNGVKVYLLTWNICLPPDWAAAQQLTEFGADTPLSRQYTRYAVAELLRTYPTLGGLATMAAEAPPGCIDFVLDAVVGGMNDHLAEMKAAGDASQPPELLFWTWCSYPEDARAVVDAYPNTRLMHYVQYEQWFKPLVDPRVGRFERWTAAAGLPAPAPAISTATLGGPKSSLAYLFWGDPEWIWRMTIDLRRQGTAGLFFEPYCAESWLAREAFAAYAYAPADQFNPTRWQDRLDEVYGAEKYGKQLLEAAQHASAIVPRFLSLLHSQSDHYMPQFGLPLVHYLEMPTLSTYVFENTQTVDERGYLTPRLGLTWPNPDWGEDVAGIHDFVANRAPRDATTPDQVARDIQGHVSACQSLLTSLRHHQPGDPDQAAAFAVLLDRLELNVALGEHFNRKITAAIAWESFKAQRGRRFEITQALRRSVESWDKVVEITGRLYPDPVRFWQSQIVVPPPWTQNELWDSYRLVEGHWRDQGRLMKKELELVENELTMRNRDARLPLWDELAQEAKEDLATIHRIEFDQPDSPNYTLGEGAGVAPDIEVFTGDAPALLVDTRSLGEGYREVLVTDPQRVPIRGPLRYQISLAYRVIDGGTAHGAPFVIGVRPVEGGPLLGDHPHWNAPNEYAGKRFLKTPALEQGKDYCLVVGVHGPAAVVFDRIIISAIREPTATSEG